MHNWNYTAKSYPPKLITGTNNNNKNDCVGLLILQPDIISFFKGIYICSLVCCKEALLHQIDELRYTGNYCLLCQKNSRPQNYNIHLQWDFGTSSAWIHIYLYISIQLYFITVVIKQYTLYSTSTCYLAFLQFGVWHSLNIWKHSPSNPTNIVWTAEANIKRIP